VVILQNTLEKHKNNIKKTIMKYFKIFPILLFCFAVSVQSCKDSATDSATEGTESMEVTDSPMPPSPPTTEPAQNAAGVWHYTCGKGCAGGGGSAGTNCATCGGPLAHNQAYHANDNANPTNPTIAPPTNPTNAMPTTVPPPTAEPAQNAAGVWHYTCGKGCAGGAGALGNCLKCGGALAHNQAYHN